MISVPEVVVERVAAAIGSGEPLADLAAKSARAVGANGIVAVVAATFSNPERFPSLAVRVAASLGLPPSVAAFDLQMACSAYPYALYLAGRLALDLGGKVLVVDGDVQSPFVDESDHATGKIFSDACTATVVSANPDGTSAFDFLSRQDEALLCASGYFPSSPRKCRNSSRTSFRPLPRPIFLRRTRRIPTWCDSSPTRLN